MTTAVLRVVYTLGAPGTGTLASFLRGRRVPMVLGYDPLFHVLQEEDLGKTILFLDGLNRVDLSRDTLAFVSQLIADVSRNQVKDVQLVVAGYAEQFDAQIRRGLLKDAALRRVAETQRAAWMEQVKDLGIRRVGEHRRGEMVRAVLQVALR